MYFKIVIVSDHGYLEEALAAHLPFAHIKWWTSRVFEYNEEDLFIVDEIPVDIERFNIIKVGSNSFYDCVKPFALKSLIEIIDHKLQQRVFIIRDLEFRPHLRSLKNAHQELILTNRAAELLYFFIANPGLAFEAKQILYEVWGYNEDIITSTLDTHVYELRRNLEQMGVKDYLKCKNSTFFIDKAE